jgi:hypothetical protein
MAMETFSCILFYRPAPGCKGNWYYGSEACLLPHRGMLIVRQTGQGSTDGYGNPVPAKRQRRLAGSASDKGVRPQHARESCRGTAMRSRVRPGNPAAAPRPGGSSPGTRTCPTGPSATPSAWRPRPWPPSGRVQAKKYRSQTPASAGTARSGRWTAAQAGAVPLRSG